VGPPRDGSGNDQKKTGVLIDDLAMQELSDATTALSEATSSCMGHLAAQNPELIDWVSAVRAHARAVEAAVESLGKRLASQ